MDICNQYVGDANYLESPHLLLTTHRLAQKITDETGHHTTASAVHRVLRRWEGIGFALVAERPVAFLDYTELAVDVGLTELENRHKEALKQATSAVSEKNRAKARAITTPVVEAAPPADDEPDPDVFPEFAEGLPDVVRRID